VLWHRKSEEDNELELPILVLDSSGATSEMLLGRSTECDLLIPDPSVSRRHAQLFFRDGKWILVDLDSKNGTYINGVQVQRAELMPGDVVALGVECLRVD
jgi:pSer/pThr/pTyr-binding forkhead associated (FHA) protein